MNVVNRQLLLQAANGKHMSGIEVFSAAIKFLKKHFLENIKNRNARSNVTVDRVRWVLTVPAIWNDAAKQFMRESAEKVTFLLNSKCLYHCGRMVNSCFFISTYHIRTLQMDKIKKHAQRNMAKY